jgi:hypothetical protein
VAAIGYQEVGGLARDFPQGAVAGIALNQLEVSEGPFQDDSQAVPDSWLIVADQNTRGAVPFEE